MQNTEIEHSVDQKREGKLKIRAILLILLYVGVAVGELVIVFNTVMIALGAIIPLTVYTLVLCTWRFVDIEQKYTIESGYLTLYRKFGNSKAKAILKIKIKDAILIAPLTKCKAELDGVKTYNALSSLKSENAFAVIYEEDGKRCALLIDVIDRTLRSLKYYSDRVSS